ncbi:hypothetical protein B0H11DRAFT_1903899 [Mycena galericulata]|nr:hypothetical protein B0H11DRAFT_1903899 [Mycena galericulata]
MAAQSRAGVPLPLPVDFDFVGHMTRPADIPPPSFFELDDINADNLAREKKNKASLKLTRAYLEAKNSAAGVTNEDVGEPLVPYYEYSDADKRLMIADRDVVTAVGPLPQYMILFLGAERVKIQQTRESDKDKREAECAAHEAEKTKAVRPIFGTLTLPNPHSMSSYDATNIVIPDIYHVLLHHKIYFPLHWWSDKYIRQAMDHPHTIPTRSITAEQTSALVALQQVTVVDVAKLERFFGANDLAALTPGVWKQAAKNLLDSFTKLCPPVIPGDPVLGHTHASEFAHHAQHFAKLSCHEDLEMFPVWYPVEYELRMEIFRGGLYDRSYHDTRINVAIATYQQANPSTPSFPTVAFTASAPNLKRPSPDEGGAGNSKQARTGNARGIRDQRSSTPGSREGSARTARTTIRRLPPPSLPVRPSSRS